MCYLYPAIVLLQSIDTPAKCGSKQDSIRTIYANLLLTFLSFITLYCILLCTLLDYACKCFSNVSHEEQAAVGCDTLGDVKCNLTYFGGIKREQSFETLKGAPRHSIFYSAQFMPTGT